MAKFNEIQRQWRFAKAERKRACHGHPLTGKLKCQRPPVTVSGKRKRKLLKKWRRDQKECIEKGLVTMEDVEMETSHDAVTSHATGRAPRKAHLKMKRLKHIKLKKGKNKRKSPKKDNQSEVVVMDVE